MAMIFDYLISSAIRLFGALQSESSFFGASLHFDHFPCDCNASPVFHLFKLIRISNQFIEAGGPEDLRRPFEPPSRTRRAPSNRLDDSSARMRSATCAAPQRQPRAARRHEPIPAMETR
ncbi:hypothetical protein [Burkholderia sp. MSMB1589WGS]|uniref:hypothetical protein n=1 Tax=Burkholderia sp. MSMB1589WGS TaxID=1636425 RepID=UPI000A705B23|nr:hypothetical protein [Burkholderia sp. MSMB1589WGS]